MAFIMLKVMPHADMTIENNSPSGNQSGLGNPGLHEWSASPDGQVCTGSSPEFTLQEIPFDDFVVTLQPGP